MKSSSRESSIELLRIILIFIIVAYHLMVHGGKLTEVTNLQPQFKDYQKLFFTGFLLFPVNCFVFITGYYGLKINANKISNLYLRSFIYALLIPLTFYFLGIEGLYYKDFISIPLILGNKWWFIQTYILLILISPIINFAIDKIELKNFKYIIIVGLFLNFTLNNTGTNIFNFTYIYILGRYISKTYKAISIKKSYLITFYIISSLSISLVTILLLKFVNGKGIWTIYKFNNPIIVIQAICIFLLFKEISFQSKLVNFISQSAISIYMIHDHELVKNYIYKNIFVFDNFSHQYLFIPTLLLFTTIIFLCSLLIDITFHTLITKPIQVIFKKVINKTINLFLIPKESSSNDIKSNI